MKFTWYQFFIFIKRFYLSNDRFQNLRFQAIANAVLQNLAENEILLI